MNLKYFRNQDGDYIIFRHSTCQDIDNYIFSQSVYTTFSILPKNSSNHLEQFFDNQTQIIIDQELDRLHLNSINDLSNLRITANYQNLDIINPIFQNGVLELENIDNNSTFYKFTFNIDLYLPITKSSVSKNPIFFLKSLISSLFTNR